MDNGRDLGQFLLYYLPEVPTPAPLPTHLPRLPDAVADARRAHGLGPARTLVGLGHSVGGIATYVSSPSSLRVVPEADV
jgi:hypothetical protein